MGREACMAAATSRSLGIVWLCVSLAFASFGVAPWHAAQRAGASADGLWAASSASRRLRSEAVGGAGGAATALLETSEEHKNKDNPIVDFCVGVFLLPMAFALLWLNEGHAARMNLMLRFLDRKVKLVRDGAAEADDERKPVFVTGEGRTEDALALEEWGGLVAPPSSVKLRAMSFMYQWEEEKDDNKTKYKKKWVHHQVNSDSFQEKSYVNPDFPVQPTTVELAKVTIGRFVLSMKMLGKFQNYKPCEIDASTLAAISNNPRMASYGSPQRTQFQLPIALSDIGSAPAFYFPRNGSGGSLENPGIGDLKVVFQYVECGPMSVLGVQVPVADHPMGGILVPGTRCEVQGRAAEISEVTPPPRPFQVHWTHGARGYVWKEAGDILPKKTPKPWHQDATCPWTFVPVQYTQEARSNSWGGLMRAGTATINVGDEARQTLLGDNEMDVYLEDVRSVAGHLTHGANQAIKMMSCNPIGLARAFLQGSSPDEVCLAYPETLTFGQAMAKEKELEKKVNNGVRLFGALLMYTCFCLIMKPLFWVLSWFWIFGAMVIFLLKLGACVATVFCSSCTMAGAWIWYRPEFGIPMFCGIMGLLYVYQKQVPA